MGIGDYSGGKGGRGVVKGGGVRKRGDWLLSQHHCNSNSRPLSMKIKICIDYGFNLRLRT